MYKYSLKDVIRINQDFGNGNIVNRASIEFALDKYKRKSWLKEMAEITRALVLDHTFQDGNKRTAHALFILTCEDNGFECNSDRLNKSLHTIAKKRIANLEHITMMLKNVIRKKN